MADTNTTSNPRKRRQKTIEMEPAPMLELQEQEQALEEAIEQAEEEKRQIEEKKRGILGGLAHKISVKYKERAARRAAKESMWLGSERNYLGSLSIPGFSTNPDDPFGKDSNKKKRPDKNIVWTRCEIAKAQLVSMQFSGDEKNWMLLPPMDAPPDPGISDVIERMESVIADQLEACNYKGEVTDFLHNLVVLGTGILKGPVNTGKVRKRYVRQSDEMGAPIWVPQLTSEKVPEIKNVPLWFAYPDDSVTKLSEAADFIHLHPMSRHDLINLTKNPAFSDFSEDIMKAAAIGPSGDSESAYDFTNLTDSNPYPYKNKYVVLEFHGPITRTDLETLEIEPPYDVPGDEYFGEVWVCNNTVIRIELENIEGCGKPPYSGDVWQADPSSPFGFGLAAKLNDAQRVVTQAWHMILDNASMSSAPQVVINEDVIDPRNGEYLLRPGKIWYSSDISGDVGKAFDFFNVTNTQEFLFPVMQSAEQDAESESGFSLSIGGLQSPQVVSDTATGIAVQQRAANVLLDQKSDSIDTNAIEPRLKAMYDWNMQYNPDDSIKQDLIVRIKSSTEYRNKEMYIRDMEKLSVETANNPELAKHLEMNALARTRLSMMSLPTKNIVKPLEQVMQEEQQRAQHAAENPPPEVLEQQIEMRRVELEERKQALEEQKLMFELQQNQQREAWEHEERMVNTYARISEAQAQVLKSQNEKEMALIQLAARAETDQQKNQITANIAVMNDETKRWLAGVEAVQKAKDQLLTEKEQELKRQTGSGI